MRREDDKQICIALPESEKELIEKGARLSHQSMSGFIRYHVGIAARRAIKKHKRES